jgi:hypothetical protein
MSNEQKQAVRQEMRRLREQYKYYARIRSNDIELVSVPKLYAHYVEHPKGTVRIPARAYFMLLHFTRFIYNTARRYK